MSQRRRKKDEDKSSDSGLASAVATGVAAVGVAALAYGAWRLYEYLTTPDGDSASAAEAKAAKKLCDSSDEDESSSSSRGREDRMRPGNQLAARRSTNFSENNQTSRSVNMKEVSLSDKLLQYHRSYVEVSPADVREVTKVVKNVKMQLARCLSCSEKLANLNVSQIKEIGSSVDCTMVVFPRQFDILIPFELSTGDVYVGPHGLATDCHSISVVNDFQAWSSVCDDQNRLDPQKFVYLLREVLEETAHYCVRDNVKLTLKPTYAVMEGCTNTQQKFTVNLVPAITVGQRCFVAMATDGAGVGWRESFYDQEHDCLFKLGPGVTGHRIILQIFKAIRLNFPLQFGILSSYHMKTVLFRIMDDQMNAKDWETSALSERFIDFLIELGNCLKEKHLAHYFQGDRNLFDQIPPESSQNLAQFINRIIGKHEITSLLKDDYTQ